MIEPLGSVYPTTPITVYWENRISAGSEARMIAVAGEPHVVYNSNGELILVPDGSWGVGSVYA
tara:strand:+ start:369 stop:557 length:189 start_codon:yes stop_codon:yes gene_type:complete